MLSSPLPIVCQKEACPPWPMDPPPVTSSPGARCAPLKMLLLSLFNFSIFLSLGFQRGRRPFAFLTVSGTDMYRAGNTCRDGKFDRRANLAHAHHQGEHTKGTVQSGRLLSFYRYLPINRQSPIRQFWLVCRFSAPLSSGCGIPSSRPLFLLFHSIGKPFCLFPNFLLKVIYLYYFLCQNPCIPGLLDNRFKPKKYAK